ncbi:MAG: hypothetical protein COV45_07945 [Deltaproteobacteria bacterium CG11_big_fil_rev_8_21_14_0_20_47_16]|nr:MAG: hypothetical protein COV45_07945 [Deltaproteobacteria bacterium CG11_big_fil_rev_8_21_14_0_20_47_16]
MAETPKVSSPSTSSAKPDAQVTDAAAKKPVADVAATAPKETEQAQPKSDQYRTAQRVAHFLEVVEQHIAWSGGFRLPGSERMVHDRRSEGEGRSERGERHERAGERDSAGARKAPGDKRAHGNAGEREVIERANKALQTMEAALLGKNPEGQAEGKEKSLSAFEKTLIARFEEAEGQVKESADGQKHFLKKTAGEWMNFFEKFVNRTLQKVVGWDDVQGFLFRGLVQEKGVPQKGVLISDVQTMMGTDKFARLSVSLPKLMAFAAANPGVAIPKEVVQAALLSEQLRYLALGPQKGDDAAAAQFTQAASRGMFASQQVENRVAEQLGLISEFRGGVLGRHDANTVEGRRQAESRRRRGGMWAKWFGGEDVNGEGSVFIPWWRWDREERGGSRRWFVVVFGTVAIVILVGLIFALFHNLR